MLLVLINGKLAVKMPLSVEFKLVDNDEADLFKISMLDGSKAFFTVPLSDEDDELKDAD